MVAELWSQEPGPLAQHLGSHGAARGPGPTAGAESRAARVSLAADTGADAASTAAASSEEQPSGHEADVE